MLKTKLLSHYFSHKYWNTDTKLTYLSFIIHFSQSLTPICLFGLLLTPKNLLVNLGYVLIPKTKCISVSGLSHIDSIRFFIVSSTLLLFLLALLLLLAAGGVVIVPVLGTLCYVTLTWIFELFVAFVARPGMSFMSFRSSEALAHTCPLMRCRSIVAYPFIWHVRAPGPTCTLSIRKSFCTPFF